MEQTSLKLPVWNPYTPGYRDNPYDHLRRLRKENPIHRGINGRWMLLKYEHVKSVLGDPRFRTIKLHEQLASKQALIREPGRDLNALVASVRKWLLFLDPPEHPQIRQLVVKLWNQYKVNAYIEAVTDEAIGQLRKKQQADIIADFAAFLPMKVVSRILGLPEQDYDQLRHWSNRFMYALEFNSIHQLLALNTTAAEFYQYIDGIIAAKRRQPDDSFISQFLDANDALPEPLAPADVVSVIIVLFFAGIETSVYVFGQSILNLIRFPEQTQALGANPALIQPAVEELIRFACPLQYTPRIPTEDILIDGVLLREGEIVTVSLASANRDPAIFDEPESLRFDRKHNPHISFGHSFHHCLGARLAREEMQIAVARFVAHFPNVRLDPQHPPVWEDLIINRGLRSLSVLLT